MNQQSSFSHVPDPSAEALMGQIADEFIDRMNRGEEPDIEEFAARYPDLAAVLRRVLPTFQVMRSAGTAEQPSEPPDNDGSDRNTGLSGRLGAYRLIRELGRGGMGVVYEAEQLSMRRRVALKVLPFAAVMDDKQIRRFKNEALAAGQLQHTNIVPVYSVGCERGVHYFAMQFIDGQTLAEVVRELRRSAGLDQPPNL